MATQELSGYRKVAPDPVRQRAMRIMRGTRTYGEKHFDDLEELTEVVHYLRSVGCVIVLIMGTWDLFHIGHATYILKGREEAKKLYPDAEQIIVVVGVDSDELTRERKGPKRPVVDERERSSIIGHLESVDIVTLERELGHLHRHLPHDIRIISTTTGDLEADEETTRYCEHLVNLPPQSETSTSARVRLLFIEGSQEAIDRFRTRFDALLGEMSDAFKV